MKETRSKQNHEKNDNRMKWQWTRAQQKDKWKRENK